MDNRPIGVFDSGLGGLTAVRELMRLLPGEDIVYFGDTGRVPYGNRSRETLEKYARQDCRFLLGKNVKRIIAACGTVSSVAPHVLKALPVRATGVVELAAEAAARITRNKRIGVIGTQATIHSGSFERHIRDRLPDAAVFPQACPLFVPLVENGWIGRDDEVALLTARRYLMPLKAAGVDTLILGCTHFPLLAPLIGDVMGDGVALIDSGREAAESCERELRRDGALNQTKKAGELHFYISDRPQDFTKVASMFLGREITGEVHTLDIEQVDRPEAGTVRG
ncbi:MAG TPA: glutamate racemase [Firmicutes bacterium]|nr:glutamate racemase [Bacillota bacterium]